NGSSVVPGYSDPAAYAAIYDAAAAAIHAVPHAKAAASLIDKTWNSNPVGAPYLDIFLENVTERVDVASLHPYPNNYEAASYVPAAADRWKYFTLVEDVRTKLDAADYTETTIWITEIGWPTHDGGLSEATQASRFADLWTVIGNLGYIEGLIIFCVTHIDFPDNPALPNYSATNPECFLALWHTGATRFDIASAKPAVATITGLSSIDYAATSTFNFIKPGASGELPATVGVSFDSLPEKSRGTALKYLMQPMSDVVYPATDVTSYVVNGTAPSYSGMKAYTYSSSPARLRFSGNITNFSGYGANRINGADISSSYSWTGFYWECYVNGTDVAFQCYANADGDYKVFVDGMPLVYG
ncbi:MAG TPA: glycosyl hydrolase, partial [bacterium]|nr:glycosyl hydrolase [bacterium]